MAHPAEVPRFPEDEGDKDRAARGVGANIKPFPQIPQTGMPLAVSPDILAEVDVAIDDFDDPALDDSLYTEPTLLAPTALDRMFEILSGAIDACRPYLQQSSSAARRLAARTKQLKEEKPLQFLGAIAGSAFALGMTIRFWRSRS